MKANCEVKYTGKGFDRTKFPWTGIDKFGKIFIFQSPVTSSLHNNAICFWPDSCPSMVGANEFSEEVRPITGPVTVVVNLAP